ncbi:hypothetical protein HC251_16600 [Iamia sp. SCSIO 61187]|uniref:hypothetical protein n=1 Tax=Iamia sp. SCSIO 61187 TaxID=2722752 RepID=UPI001C63998C|nr:hypothetical protein [Iamia sp. SCSIO 61187]QYG93888.1 hypothetical protein HC251_16600 [Iamia sp. SCSIO 61187]
MADGDGDGLDDVLLLEGSGVDEDASGPDGTAAPGDRLFEPTILVSGSDVAPASITSVDRGSDGTVMYAVGEAVWRIDPTSGLVSGPIAADTAFAVSGDGETLATVVDGVIRVHRVDERGGRPFADLPMGGEVTALALSPDGSTIARQRVTRAGDGTIAGTAVDVTAVADPGGWSEVERSSGVGLPAFMPDGHLAVGLGTLGASQGHAEARASEVGMANLATGEVRWSVGGGGFSFTTLDATADGAWVLVVHEGAVRAFAAVDGWLSDSGSLVGVGLGIGDITDVAW